MMHDFELHEFFYYPKNVLLKALLYLIIDWKFILAKLIDLSFTLHNYENSNERSILDFKNAFFSLFLRHCDKLKVKMS